MYIQYLLVLVTLFEPHRKVQCCLNKQSTSNPTLEVLLHQGEVLRIALQLDGAGSSQQRPSHCCARPQQSSTTYSGTTTLSLCAVAWRV
jgi:hypothetical protein